MEIKKIALNLFDRVKISLWFVVLLFPLTVMKVSVTGGAATVKFRWVMVPIVGVAAFVLSWIWTRALVWNERRGQKPDDSSISYRVKKIVSPLWEKKTVRFSGLAAVMLFVVLYPHLFGMYHTNIMITALIYVILALGLNIHVGMGGLLNLGYAAFFAVGAYTYGLLWKYAGSVFAAAGINAGWLFWIALPLAGIFATIFGVLVSLPVLRLRGDYLAIITLAFGEIVRMFIQNSGDLTGGASGISLIPRPWFFNMKLKPGAAAVYIYYITVALVALSILVARRIEDSRTGRALEAMREDEIACEAMGIDLVRNKLITFALGAFWAGIAGVLLAAQTTFINPDSFTLWESIMILMAVVIGGTGSIPGAIVGALLLKLLPEYFRALSQYRMLIYGVAMIVIIIFKPDGLLPRNRKKYAFRTTGEGNQ
ncbi:branched-chain amino acid ABC transporter permease [Treponema zuelzerae]|uniref:Branched-chain amino acid ABC transporter permease n=1 Tax=Teretinema zuelzerae TaxID=156 RepID=A0AAE3EIZ0_9SPIR|nr:branched-chain amino acid ABC transporter permease [Teretinema zuelzerae]MCD1655584.1 branched-chain amino acid ABC transporter permease [Teretinema zuelzerae]